MLQLCLGLERASYPSVATCSSGFWASSLAAFFFVAVFLAEVFFFPATFFLEVFLVAAFFFHLFAASAVTIGLRDLALGAAEVSFSIVSAFSVRERRFIDGRLLLLLSRDAK